MKYGYLANGQPEILKTPFFNGLLDRSDGSNIIQGKFNVNLGDVVQGLGVQALYRHMGISDKDIIPVERNSLAVYTGEDVVVPLNFYFTIGSSSCFPPSPNVVPVFFGYAKDSVYNYLGNPISAYRDYYKMFEPIGCRDHSTCITLQNLGVDAYVSGCASFLIPKRTEPIDNKVFIVDVQQECIDQLPASIRDNAIFLTNNYLISTDGDMAQESFRATSYVQSRMNRYAQEARLVITSRLHVAIPCVAMGIPVVYFYWKYDDPGDWHRFTWLAEILPVFSIKDVPTIDWDNPPLPLIDVEAKKKQMMDRASSAVQSAVQKYNNGEFESFRQGILESTLISYKNYVDTSIQQARENIQSIRAMNSRTSDSQKAAMKCISELELGIACRQEEEKEKEKKNAEIVNTILQEKNQGNAYLADVERKLTECKASYEALLLSKSWRYTAPFRKILSILRR